MFHLLLALLTTLVFGAEYDPLLETNHPPSVVNALQSGRVWPWCEDMRFVAMTWNFHPKKNNVEQDVIEATIGKVLLDISCKPQVFAIALQEFAKKDLSDNFDRFMITKGYEVQEAYKHDRKGGLKDKTKNRCVGGRVGNGELRNLCLMVYGQPGFILRADWEKALGKESWGKGYIVARIGTQGGTFNLAGLHFQSGINNFHTRREEIENMIMKPVKQFDDLVLNDAETIIMGDWNTRYHWFDNAPWSIGSKSGSKEWSEKVEKAMKKIPNEDFMAKADLEMNPAYDEMSILFGNEIASQNKMQAKGKSKELKEAAFSLNLKDKWVEPEVEFGPTHKIKPNGVGGAIYYQKEPPSWTDRVICTKKFKNSLHLEDEIYNSVEGTLKTSDHYPVYRVWKGRKVKQNQKSDKANKILGNPEDGTTKARRFDTMISAENIDSKSLSKLLLEYIFSPGGVFLVILLVGIATKHLCCRKRNEFDRKIEQPLLV